ncbi:MULTISPECIES: hypothetical protein [Rhizobium/Agrobacterium group]|uniref:hypothetical protein n=1 Tax=Rhizobium/Agrobacterium group TaxID=227290 RepID=UPI000B2E4E4E|nr:hypothetical protein [Rhizobium sp. Root483D2]
MLVGAVALGHFLVGLPGLVLTATLPDPADLPVVLLGGTAMAGAQFLMVQSLRMAPAALVAPAQYLKLVWGLLFGLVIFGDSRACTCSSARLSSLLPCSICSTDHA